MSILLTDEQAQAVVDYDDNQWPAAETGLLAGQAFGRLDDTDYSEYLRAVASDQRPAQSV